MKSLTQKTKIWHNNAVSRRFGKYSFQNQKKIAHIFMAISAKLNFKCKNHWDPLPYISFVLLRNLSFSAGQPYLYIIHFIHRPNEDENEVSRIAKIKQYATPTAQENARCKVCFKKFGDGEFFKLCCSCKGKVCEDCSASYGPKEAEVSIFLS